MIPKKIPTLACCLLSLLCASRFAATQSTPATQAAADPFAKDEQDLVKRTTSTLLTFGSTAKSNKVGQRAKQAFDLVLAYDPDNSQARQELGFVKDKGKWVELPPEKRKKWVDRANYEARFKIADEWYKTSMKLGELHRVLGLKLKAAGNLVRATHHLDKAVYYNAMDKEANEALGYKLGEGFYGTDAQIAFATRMKEIEKKAVEIARKEYEVKELPLESMPAELQKLQAECPDWMRKPDINIFGAQGPNFTVWSRGRQEDANDAVQWSERALEFCVYLIGEKESKRLQFVERATRTYAWFAFLFTTREREEFLKANPNTWQGEKLEDAMRFANTTYRAKEGVAVVKVGPSPKYVHDSMIAYVLFTGLLAGRNDGVGQGFVHAVTWYLKSTSISKWGALPEGSAGEDALELPEGTNWWLRTVRDQAVSHQDWPIAQVPRERLSRFRNDCRLKSWSFMTWLIAAYPDQWLKFFLAMPNVDKKVPTLEEVEPIIVKELGKSSEAIDAEWREWARGDSGVAYGTGYGPPLLPERPSKEELAAVDRVNLVRAQPFAFSWPKDKQPMDGAFSGLPPCDLDAEASLGCETHARYITNHPELTNEQVNRIHEENPAHPDFTRRGQLAAAGNIITGTGARGAEFARDSIDGWISAPYHRFPMLEHNIKRLGYAWLYENDILAAVLDMGSLEEPYDPAVAPKLIAWPPHNMKDVPTHFGDPEHPNPLADQPEDQQDVTKCGYAISLQLQQEFSLGLKESSIQLFEARKGGKPPTKNAVIKDQADWSAWVERCKKDEVPIWVHTPKVPLNKKLDLRDVIFCIPKEPLDQNRHYQVRVMLHQGEAPFWFIWEFTTGTQKEGLSLK